MCGEPIADRERVAHGLLVQRVLVAVHHRAVGAGAALLDRDMPECVKHERNSDRVLDVARLKGRIRAFAGFCTEAIPVRARVAGLRA